MAEVTWSAPLVQYARCEIKFDSEELGDYTSEDFGMMYADWLHGVMKGFEERKAELARGVKPGDLAPERLEEIKKTRSETSIPQLGEPEKPVSHKHVYTWVDVPNGGPCGSFCETCGEEDPEAAAELIKSELGATVVDKEPWNAPAPEKKTPWKSGSPVKKISNPF